MRFSCAVEALTQPPSVLRFTIQYISFVVQVFVRWALRRLSPSPPAQRRIAGYVLNARSMDRNPAPCEGSASFAVTMVRGRAGLTSTSNLAASGEPSRARIRLPSCYLLSSRRIRSSSAKKASQTSWTSLRTTIPFAEWFVCPPMSPSWYYIVKVPRSTSSLRLLIFLLTFYLSPVPAWTSSMTMPSNTTVVVELQTIWS